jgi:c-di-GMP-binding flagellar brake protein YcgR
VGGMVQGNYAKQEVGIKFVDVSERNRKRLEDLIAELQDRDREAKDN